MEENVFLFLSNLIGYARIVLSFLCFYYMHTHPGVCVLTYLLSQYLDDWDGWAARKYDQVTNFGAIMDIVTDRITLIGLLMGMCQIYPSYSLVFQIVMVLEICANWILTHTTILYGTQDHKSFILRDPLAHAYLKLIYGSKAMFYLMWVGSHIFYPFLYLCHFSVGPTVGILGYKVGAWMVITAASFPSAFGFQIMFILQLTFACRKIAAYDVLQRASKQDE